MLDNLNDDEKEKVTNDGNERKKGKLDNGEKEQLKKYHNKRKNKRMITLMMMEKNG